jgi:hypothetical protein
MIEIGPEPLILHWLASHDAISIAKLKEIRNALENAIPELYVDISKAAVLTFVEFHPDYLEWASTPPTIRKVGTIDPFENHLPDEVAAAVLAVLDSGRTHVKAEPKSLPPPNSRGHHWKQSAFHQSGRRRAAEPDRSHG